jgi:hypothetical protein
MKALEASMKHGPTHRSLAKIPLIMYAVPSTKLTHDANFRCLQFVTNPQPGSVFLVRKSFTE